MKNIAITILFLYYVHGLDSNIKVLTTENNEENLNAANVRLSDLLTLQNGVGDFSICYRYFLQRLAAEGKTFLMRFDHNGEEHILTYLMWTIDGSTVQLFQRFFREYVQAGRSGFLDQVLSERYPNDKKFVHCKDLLSPFKWRSFCFVFDKNSRNGKVYFEKQLLLQDTLR